MFVVASRWDALPGQYERFEAAGRTMMGVIRAWPEVEFFHNVQIAPESVLAIIGYKSKADYERLVQDPSGPFESAAKAANIESAGKWAWSERGETID